MKDLPLPLAPAAPFNPSDWMGRLRKGEEAGFKAFFDANFSHLYRFVYVRMACDEQATMEVVRATLCEAVRNVVRLHSSAYAGVPALIWALRICRLEIAELQARRARETSRRPPNGRIPKLHDVIVGDAHDPERRQAGNEDSRLRLIVRICDQLPEMEGTALELKYVGSCSSHEVARLLDLPSPAAQDLIARARNLFQQILIALPEEKSTEAYPR